MANFTYRRVSNGAEFSAVMRDISNAMQDEFVEILQKLALDAFRSVVRRSPVDKGYLRHNWDVSVDSTPSESPVSEMGGRRYARPRPLDVGQHDIRFGSIIIIYNNTEYAIHIEEGTPKMRAQPMVRPTEQMLFKTAERLVAALSRQGWNI